MSVTVRRHPEVAYDIVEIVDYIAVDSGDAALRFAPAVEAAIRGLAEMLGKGSLKEFDHPRLVGVRS